MSTQLQNPTPDQYLTNPALPVIRKDWQGNPMYKGRFLNEFRPGDHSLKKVLKWMLQANPQKQAKKQDHWTPALHDPKPFLQGHQDGMFWLGHATFFIRMEGVTFLTDPVFFGGPMMKRKTALPLEIKDLPKIDYVLLSHGHYDHCDKKSLKLLQQHNAFELLCPLRLSSVVQKWLPDTKIQEAGWYQQFDLPIATKLFMLPAFHWHKRGLLDEDTCLWGSFLLQGPSQTVYFGADSGYERHFKEIQKLFPEMDVCLLGVGAYSPNFMMRDSHTNPEEAVQAFHDLGGKRMVPMHYGTFDLSDEPASEPATQLKAMEQSGAVHGQLCLLGLGEPLLF
ncbi:MBL fold metallo-hydrolase [Nibribacter ruber]|uniref:MBL fold metallo-hydrolase n=1 Tax=Nibribacter ruber TaxID=2698458 RepID=A0A6P1NV62_9BACT|nr:MBL fold metallo-hydrolase [Nibribacter ruber]QHL86159.1 MBL fold metallo-hydrolase [Nibribacter ruber]